MGGWRFPVFGMRYGITEPMVKTMDTLEKQTLAYWTTCQRIRQRKGTTDDLLILGAIKCLTRSQKLKTRAEYGRIRNENR